MHVPDAADLRPGDFVKLRRTPNSAHSGSRAVVVRTHRDSAPPYAVLAVDVRYSARGVAIRVDLEGPGELVRWEDPWPAVAPVVHDTPTVTTTDDPANRVTPRRLVAAGVVAVVATTALVVWHHAAAPEERYAASTGRAAAAGGVSLGERTTDPAGVPASTSGPSGTASPGGASTGTATGRVVAYSAGPVPVVAEVGTAPRAVPLAGITPVAGCEDEYAHDLLDLLPVGELVTVLGAGWYSTQGGVEVNVELVRRGLAGPVALPGTPDGEDAASEQAVEAAVPDEPAACA